MDRTTKGLMAAVAAGLFANALTDLIPVARAADAIECRVVGPMEVKLSDFGDELEISLDYGTPGTSSSNPLHVKPTD